MADNENVSAIPEEPHFRLLDLPVEVRRMILRYFLVKKERIFLAYRTQRVNFRELIFHLQPAGDLHAGLLRTSRQLAVEGLRTLYGENTFTFGCKGVWLSESRYKPCQPIFFVTAVGYDNAKLVRSVYCDPYCARFLDEKDMELYPVETTMEYHDEAARAIDDVLKSFHGLRTLTIDFSRCTAALTKTSVVVLMLLKLPLQELQSLDIKGLADEELENFIKTEALEHVDQLTRKFKEKVYAEPLPGLSNRQSQDVGPFRGTMAEDLNLTESSYGTDTAPSDSVVISVDLLDHLVTVVRRYPFTNDGSTLSSMETLLAQLEEVRNSARRP